MVEMSHLSCLLIAVESGRASEFVGTKLSDINVSGILLLNVRLLNCLVYHLVSSFYAILFVLCKCNKFIAAYCFTHGNLELFVISH